MTQYHCPICQKRACDSNKILKLSKLSKSNESKADVVIKCQNCKSTLAIKLIKEAFVTEQISPHREVIS